MTISNNLALSDSHLVRIHMAAASWNKILTWGDVPHLEFPSG